MNCASASKPNMRHARIKKSWRRMSQHSRVQLHGVVLMARVLGHSLDRFLFRLQFTYFLFFFSLNSRSHFIFSAFLSSYILMLHSHVLIVLQHRSIPMNCLFIKMKRPIYNIRSSLSPRRNRPLELDLDALKTW